MTNPINPRHEQIRGVLRIIGPTLAGIGVIFIVVGIGSFFASFGTFEPPKYFWCVFVGMPLLFVGVVLSKFAFLGAVTRYTAGEVAPVGKDVTNYMVSGTKGAIRDAAAAVAEGFSAAGREGVTCRSCGSGNETSANFCQNCGAPLAGMKRCEKCGDLNPADARFCDHCGAPG